MIWHEDVAAVLRLPDPGRKDILMLNAAVQLVLHWEANMRWSDETALTSLVRMRVKLQRQSEEIASDRGLGCA